VAHHVRAGHEERVLDRGIGVLPGVSLQFVDEEGRVVADGERDRRGRTLRETPLGEQPEPGSDALDQEVADAALL
jgi:hypothetical protein